MICLKDILRGQWEIQLIIEGDLDMDDLQQSLQRADESMDAEEVEKILQKQLKIDNRSIEKWLQLAIIEMEVPFCDYFKSIECTETVLNIDSKNMLAILIECCVNQFYLGGIPDTLFRRLRSIKTDDNEWKSIVKYMMSHYYDNDKSKINKRKALLEESVLLCDKFVYNLKRLSKIYVLEGNKQEGKNLLKKAISNIKCIYDRNSKFSIISLDEFFNQYVKGTHITNVVVDSLIDELKKIN